MWAVHGELWVVAVGRGPEQLTHAKARMFQSRAYMLQTRACATQQGIMMPLLPIDNGTLG